MVRQVPHKKSPLIKENVILRYKLKNVFVCLHTQVKFLLCTEMMQMEMMHVKKIGIVLLITNNLMQVFSIVKGLYVFLVSTHKLIHNIEQR